MSKTHIFLSSILIFILQLSAAKPKMADADSVKKPEDPIVITVNYTVEKGATVPEHFADTLKKAQTLLSKVFSSKEFKAAMYKQSFNDSAYSKSKKACFEKLYDPKNGKLTGELVYANLLANPVIDLSITIKNNGDKKTTMGLSYPCVSKFTTFDYWLVTDTELARRLARHIAHEFTHIRGYRHDNNVPDKYKWGRDVEEDPAYGVGSIVGEILTNWSKKGMI